MAKEKREAAIDLGTMAISTRAKHVVLGFLLTIILVSAIPSAKALEWISLDGEASGDTISQTVCAEDLIPTGTASITDEAQAYGAFDDTDASISPTGAAGNWRTGDGVDAVIGNPSHLGTFSSLTFSVRLWHPGGTFTDDYFEIQYSLNDGTSWSAAVATFTQDTSRTTYGPYSTTAASWTDADQFRVRLVYTKTRRPDNPTPPLYVDGYEVYVSSTPPAAADMVDLYHSNDGTYFYVKETLVADPDASSFTYVVYMDFPNDVAPDPEYRMVYTSGKSQLEQMVDTTWEWVKDITITPGTQEIVFKVALSDIGYYDNPGKSMDLWFVNYEGADTAPASGTNGTYLDRAPDTGFYLLSYTEIPEWEGVMKVITPAIICGTVGYLFVTRVLPHTGWLKAHKRKSSSSSA